MLEVTGDLWELECDARAITTNGSIRRDGAAVMGRGCALEAKKLFIGIERVLGKKLSQNGNHVQILTEPGLTPVLVSYPVKHQWAEPADLDLIRRSARELVELATRHGWKRVVLPRPGCGNGKRSWETEVKPLLAPILDDRFTCVDFGR